jgi:PIN domain nuclease of toxin-antitoxin system
VNYVLDACALLAFLNKEDGWEKVRKLLVEAAHAGDTQVYMNSVNLLEVYYDRLRLGDTLRLSEFFTLAFESTIQIIDTISRPVLDEAARMKAVFRRVSLADTIGMASAVHVDGVFVTSDHHELDAVDRSGSVRFLWIR